MNRLIQVVVVFPSLLFGMLMLGACSDEPASSATGSQQMPLSDTVASGLAAKTGEGSQDDVIARVGDEVITFGEINVMLNSAAVVGLSIPALGTPERDNVRIVLLDKFVDANLIYLDALRKGVDQDPRYQSDLQRFTTGMQAELYVDNILDQLAMSR